ncbi:Uma2 family endonuclease [Pyxidicoccus fallax]|uniref:Uma2 family endonuclease n=1 Tax=Pyxidicoccus fallax TaxID=394095 RepID=A0A848LW94_9BACT|nr:Uma2 family endonuclease [Pyxidicoccus fallax]NMO21554.1 Uma2 family endonuclease [Pyxidicoccus fallax]NPC85716.1 Uma2 family endonuclease [Pyxidicoccus fallax]
MPHRLPPEMDFLIPRRFTVEEYHRLREVGVLDEDEHVELLEGIIAKKRVSGAEPWLVVPRRFTPKEYHQLIRVGVLGQDEPVELLEGVVAEMTPMGKPHARLVARLTRILGRALGDTFSVRPQLPLCLGRSEPEPDIAVVTQSDEERARVHPRTALLVVEVADDSIRRDREAKSRIYARARIPEYWIVDVAREVIEVYTEPHARRARYLAHRTVGAGGRLKSSALPGVSLEVADLFN